MLWQVLACPQCGGTLPKQARWRLISCPYCKATVGLGQEMVRAASFREAWQRAQAGASTHTDRLDFGRQSYHLLTKLDGDPHVEVFLAARLLPTAAVARVALATDEQGAVRLRREAEALDALRQNDAPGAAVFGRRLPQVLGLALSTGPVGAGRLALALHHPPGAWGSLAQALAISPGGIEPTHAVWMWRRILDILTFVHGAGWVHFQVDPEHLLVHPEEHLVHLIGWSDARPYVTNAAVASGSLRDATVQRDLVQSAWTVRALIAGHAAGTGEPSCDRAPAPLAELLRRVTGDLDYSRGLGAAALNDQVAAAARQTFGPPRWVPFHLPPR